MKKLLKRFRLIKENHRKTIRTKCARLTIGSSVGRVLKKGSKEQIWRTLEKIPVNQLLRLKSEPDYKKWFEKQLNVVARKINKTNPKKENKRIHPGYKWGHATKILCLYLRSVVMDNEYFSQSRRDKIKYWLYCPIDGVVMNALEECDVSLPFKKIKDIDTSKKFYDIQDMLKHAANKIKAPGIWFDDNWAARS